MTSEKWYTLAGYPEYSICDEYPHPIRKKTTGKILSEYTNDRGYVMVRIGGKNVRKHRLIATQFIPNPDELPQVTYLLRPLPPLRGSVALLRGSVGHAGASCGCLLG